MLQRELSKHLLASLKTYDVLTILGPRQSGKTTLARHLLPSFDYQSLENPDERAFANEYPKGFLSGLGKNCILDEFQKNATTFALYPRYCYWLIELSKPLLDARSYFRLYVEKDIRQITNIKNIDSFERFVKLAAGRAGQLLISGYQLLKQLLFVYVTAAF